MKVAQTKAEAEAEIDLVKKLTGEIIGRAEANGWTRDELARRAGKKSAVTLYGWRNGKNKSPSLLDLQAYARAVGLDVRLLEHSASGVSGVQVNPVGGALHPETADVVKVMEGASDELRAAIKDKILSMVTERASLPLGPGEDTRSSHARRK